MNIKAKTFRGSLWSVAGTAATMVSNFVVFALLARLLQPVDFGLVAFAALFIDIAKGMVGSFTEALIQRKEWNEVTASTAFWTNLASALAFAAMTPAIAVPIAYRYGSPALAEVFIALALSLAIDGARGVHEAKLRRDFGYKVLAIRTVVASVIGGAAGIALAFAGFGVWALVATRLIAATLQTIIVLNAARWSPKLVFSKAECAGLLRFGTDMMAARLMGQISTRVAQIAIGMVLGPAALGLYHIASRALNLFHQITITPLQTTALSAFARLHDNRAVANAYVRVTRATALVSFPIYFGAAATAPDLVVVFFGRQWEASGAIMTALALSVIPATLFYFTQPALTAVGRTRLVLASNFAAVALNTVVALATVAFGVVAVAVGQTVRVHLTAPFALSMLSKGIGLPMGQALRSVAGPALAAGLMGVVVIAARLYAFEHVSPAPRLVLCVLVGGLVYAAFLLTLARRYTAETMLELMPLLPATARGVAQKILPRV
jgi:O-antigen/teichoic acid export membrane protein